MDYSIRMKRHGSVTRSVTGRVIAKGVFLERDFHGTAINLLSVAFRSRSQLQFEFATFDQESQKLQVAYDGGTITPTGLIPLP